MAADVSATPYDAAVDEVGAKIQGLQSALDTLLRLQADHRGPNPSARAASGDAEVSHDTFFGMTIGDAAHKYLGMVKVTKSNTEIAKALEQGGLKHSSKSFTTTVRSILGARADFLRVPNGDWGLAEWYPGMGRGKKPKAERHPPTKKRHSPKVEGGTRKERILKLMQTAPNKAWKAGEIAKALGDVRRLIQTTMGSMKLNGELAKDTVGYRLPAKEAA
jgi:hypothetical protein